MSIQFKPRAALFAARGNTFFAIIILAGVLLVSGCASVSVEKVPTPSQYVVWTDEMQREADDMEGFRFYLPRPFVNVFESFPIRTDILLAEAIVSPDGQYVVIRQVYDENGNQKYRSPLEGVKIDRRNVGVGAPGEQSDEEKTEDEPSDDGALPGTASGLARPSGTAAAAPPVTGQNVRGVANDNSAYAYQPMRGNLDVAYLPDFDEQYVVSSSAGLGNAEFQLNLGQGWSLQGFNSLSDNSQLNKRIFDLLDTSSQLAQQAAMAAAGLPPVPAGLPGTTAVAPQSDKEAAALVSGTPVTLKIVIVHYAAKGLYPVIKPRELQERSVKPDDGEYFLFFDLFQWFPLATPATQFDQTAIARARQAIENETGKFTVPRYPYQYVSFNTFRYMAVETLTPGAHPFGTLYDKTGTAGDPGDRRLDPPKKAQPGLSTEPTKGSGARRDSGRKDGAPDLDKLAKALRFQSVGFPGAGGKEATFTVQEATVDGDKVAIKLTAVGKADPAISTDDIKKELAKNADQGPGSADHITIANQKDLAGAGVTGIEEQSDEEDLSQQSSFNRIGRFGMRTSVTDAQVRSIQNALCLSGRSLDGRWGPRTQQMLIKYQKETGQSRTDGILTSGLKEQILDLRASEIDRRCERKVGGLGPPAIIGTTARQALASNLEVLQPFDLKGIELSIVSASSSAQRVDVVLASSGNPASTITLSEVKKNCWS